MGRMPPTLRPVAQYTLQCGRKLRPDTSQVTRSWLRRFGLVNNARRMMSVAAEEERKWLNQQTLIINRNISYNGSQSTPREKTPIPTAIAMNILFLIVAAMHTSAIAAPHVLYGICAHLEFMEELRAEAPEEAGANR
ncbi:hypothetical protein DL767_004003 [Monosporascus sp. MG133]|nr:hypothetical protein DL767_004003 [Monosporascus sp. MG133]